MAEFKFGHLNCHSYFSLGRALPSPEELVEAAVSHEMTALALTDENSLAGALEFTQLCQQRKLQPILGADLRILPHTHPEFRERAHWITLLVETAQGYRNLTRLVSLAHKRHTSESLVCVTFAELRENQEGLICLLGGPKSELWHYLGRREVDASVNYLNAVAQMFGRHNLFFKLPPAQTPAERRMNERVIELAEFLGIPIVAAHDIRYLRPEDELAWLFLNDREPPPVLTPNLWAGRTVRHFADPAEIRECFTYRPQALDSVRQIVKRCNFVLTPSRHLGLSPDFDRGADGDSFLWNLAFERAAELFDDMTDEIKQQLNREFETIKKKGLSNYVRLLWQITSYLDDQHISRGVGQGYLVTSLIAHVLGLIQINPLDYNLRFHMPEQLVDATPILAVEVSARHIEDIIHFLHEEYGENCVCHAATFQRWERRALLQKLCRWARMGERRTRSILGEGWRASGQLADDDWARLFDDGRKNLSIRSSTGVLRFLFERLYRCPRTLKLREGEVFVSTEDMDYIVPRVTLPNGVKVAQMAAQDCQSLGPAQLRLVTNPSLEILDLTDEWIRRESNARFDLTRIPTSDEASYRLLHQGMTAGVPTMDSPTMKVLLRMHQPRDMLELFKTRSMDPTPRPLVKTNDELLADIPNCLLAYRCAYVKAHYPASFFTALLNQAYRQPAVIRSALHELSHFGIRLLPLDVNLSEYAFTQSGNNRIQIGLKIVHQLGEKVADEIERTRKGGHFEGLQDLCRRTDPRLINQRVIVNLIKAGALDTFGLHRSQLLAMVEGALADRREAAATEEEGQSLFELPLEEEGPADEGFPPELPELPPAVLIRNEIDVSGCAITHSPLEPYTELLRTSHVSSSTTLSPRQLDDELYFAGVVNQLATEFPRIEEGIEAIADLQGLILLLPGRLVAATQLALERGVPIMVGGRAIEKSKELFLRAHCVYELAYVQRQAERVKGLELDLAGENRRTLRTLWTLIRRFAGSTELDAVNYAGRAGGWTQAKLKAARVCFTPPFYFHLGKILPAERLRLIDAKGERFPYSYAMPGERPPASMSENS
ncbi:PHP domain-containing protein [Candidatus Sumerlaeota bacterium]